MIKLQVIGNLGADCIQKEINGKTVINFNVAHSERFKDAQGNLFIGEALSENFSPYNRIKLLESYEIKL